LASAFSPAAETNSAAMTICRSPTRRFSRVAALTGCQERE
jgi:hypothetical protein